MENLTLATREQKMWQHVREFKQRREAGTGSVSAPKTTPRNDKVRRKDWDRYYSEEDPLAYYDHDLAESEKVMPEGETEWRQAKVVRSPLHQGIGVDSVAEPAHNGDAREHGEQGQSRGTVVAVSSGLSTVQSEGHEYLCTLRKSLRIEHSGYSNMVAVGDEVVITHNGHERGVVDAILPRRSALARPDPFNALKQQVIVANVDQLLIVTAWRKPAFWPELVDRYLIAAVRHNLAPVLVINKVDLAADRTAVAAVAAAYQAAHVRVILTSAVDGEGLSELRGVLQGRTTALAGLSGVGKSSLLGAAEPGLNLRVGEVSDRRREGRHTTTQVSLHTLNAGGFVVDTPGIREMGLAGLKRVDLRQFYPDFAEAAQRCDYANCTHTREPGCGVRSAVRGGRVAALRLDNYRKILEDLQD
jgi:ribosome biogenesis GTPase / thiamine phosphate phosphatase